MKIDKYPKRLEFHEAELTYIRNLIKMRKNDITTYGFKIENVKKNQLVELNMCTLLLAKLKGLK